MTRFARSRGIVAPTIGDNLALLDVPVYAYGHSFVAGTAQQRTPWVSRLPRLTGCATPTNRGIVGNTVASTQAALYATAGTLLNPGTTGVVVLECALNDVRLHGAAGIPAWKKTVELMILMARSGSWNEQTAGTFGGGAWFAQAAVQSNARGGTIGLAIANGNYLDFTFSGSEITLALGWLKSGFSSGSTYSINIDGSLAATGTQATGASGPPSSWLVNYAIVPHTITGLSAGAHTVRLIHTGAGGDQMYVDGFITPSSTPPTVVLVVDPYITDWAGGAPYNVGSNAIADQYATAAYELAAQFPAGHVVVADPRGRWDAASMIGADGVHPNDVGASILAKTVADTMKNLTFRRGLTL